MALPTVRTGYAARYATSSARAPTTSRSWPAVGGPSAPRRACYTVGELRSAITAAHDLGRLTTAHCRAGEAMRRATEADVDCIEHGEFIDPDGVMRFDKRIAQQMADSGTYLSPTLQANGWDTILRCRRVRESRELTPAGGP